MQYKNMSTCADTTKHGANCKVTGTGAKQTFFDNVNCKQVNYQEAKTN